MHNKDTYLLLEDVVTSDEKTYRTYGIAGTYHGEDDREEYHDICTDREAVAAFVETCNELGLDPIHLKDAVQDFLISV
jgi:hypothetical protein